MTPNLEIQAQIDGINRRREHVAGNILTYLKIFAPLAAAIFAFMFSQYFDIKEEGEQLLFLIVIWLIMTTILVGWRRLAIHCDKVIVRMYPDLIRLEGRLTEFEKKETQYIFSNLSQRSRKFFKREIKNRIKKSGNKNLANHKGVLADVRPGRIKKMTLDEFEDALAKFSTVLDEEEKTAQCWLLKAHKRYRYKFVSGRGHTGQNCVVYAIIIFLPLFFGILYYM